MSNFLILPGHIPADLAEPKNDEVTNLRRLLAAIHRIARIRDTDTIRAFKRIGSIAAISGFSAEDCSAWCAEDSAKQYEAGTHPAYQVTLHGEESNG